MLDILAQATGILFLFAVAAEFIAVFFEQAGAARKRDEEAKSGGLPALALMVVTTLTPALLLLHGYLSTMAPHWRAALPAAVAAPILAVIVGAILGRIVGTASQAAARILHGVALPAAVAAFVLTIYAAWPSVGALIELFTHGYARSPPAG
jgi:hypothetical protein